MHAACNNKTTMNHGLHKTIKRNNLIRTIDDTLFQPVTMNLKSRSNVNVQSTWSEQWQDQTAKS